MDWLLLTLASVFIVSLANILQRVLMRDDKSNPYSYAFIFHILLGILNLVFALIHGFQLPPLDGSFIYFIIAAVLWGGGTVFLFKALQLLESSEVTILGSFRALITIVASIIFLRETFNLQKVLGTIIILASIFLVSNLKKGIKFNKGIIYVFVMAVMYGSAVVFDAFIVKQYDPISYLAVANLLIGSMILMFYPKALGQWSYFIKPNFLKKMLPLVFLSSAQAIAFYMALSIGGNASQIGPINQAQVIITVLLAVVFLKEKDHLLRKLIAGVLVTFGVVLLS